MALEEKFDLESEGGISMDGNYVSNRVQIEVVSEKGEMGTKSVKLNRKQGTILEEKRSSDQILAKRRTPSPLFKMGQSMVVERPDLGLRRFQSTLCLRQNCGRTYGGRETTNDTVF